MTREEQINEAANTYMNGLFEDGIEIPIEDFENIEAGFIIGAEWADANPKSHWISVDEDLPNDETKLYIIYCEAYNKNGDNIENKHYEIYLANFDKEMSSWINVESYNNYFFNVLYWMPIPKLSKE